MLGANVYYGYGSGESRTEGKGVIVDKNRQTDVVRNEKGEVVGLSQHDIYLVKKEDGSLLNLHPNNLIKVL